MLYLDLTTLFIYKNWLEAFCLLFIYKNWLEALCSGEDLTTIKLLPELPMLKLRKFAFINVVTLYYSLFTTNRLSCLRYRDPVALLLLKNRYYYYHLQETYFQNLSNFYDHELCLITFLCCSSYLHHLFRKLYLVYNNLI